MNITYQAYNQTFRITGGAAKPDWRVFDANTLRWAHFDSKTGELVKVGKDFSCKPTEEQLQEWQAVATKYALLWGNRLDDLNVPLYIRYGDLPKGGRSTNSITRKKEQGVSVYAATYDLETGAIVFDSCLSGAGTLLFVSIDRTPHLVTGQCIGEGSDGEPVLRRAKIGAELRYDAEKGGFVLAQ